MLLFQEIFIEISFHKWNGFWSTNFSLLLSADAKLACKWAEKGNQKLVNQKLWKIIKHF